MEFEIPKKIAKFVVKPLRKFGGVNEKSKFMDNKTLIDKISETTDLSRDDVQSILSEMCNIVADSCIGMDSVVIPGFGQFEAKKRKERLTIHPSTGQRLMVPPKLVLNFRPSGVLKSKIVSPDKE